MKTIGTSDSIVIRQCDLLDAMSSRDKGVDADDSYLREKIVASIDSHGRGLAD